MKSITNNLKLQRGVASLLTAVVLLTCITLVALFTSKTVVIETKMTADNYRTSQATEAAQAAMDHAVAYYGVGNNIDYDGINGPDFRTPIASPIQNPEQMPREGNCVVPAAVGGVAYPTYLGTAAYPAHAQTFSSGEQNTIGMFYFVNTATYNDDNNTATAAVPNICQPASCTATPNGPSCFTGTQKDKALIVAKGWSDDCTAVRTITQCVDKAKILKDKGPGQPFVTHGSIGIAGNATFINRFTNSNVWTGGALGSAGAAFATFLRPADKQYSDLTWEEKIADCHVGAAGCLPGSDANHVHTTDNLRLISNTKAGYGVDVIGNDPTLGNLTNDELFALFFGENTRADVKATAADNGQMFTAANIAQAVGKSGLIWIEGNATAPNIGVPPSPLPPEPSVTPAKPAILIVNGNLTIGAGATIYGVVYITGTLTVNGSPNIFGSVISESGTTSGNGSPTIVYVPWFGDDSPTTPPGIPSPVAGSWRDW